MSLRSEFKKIPNANGVAGAKITATEAATTPKVSLEAFPIFLLVTESCSLSQVAQYATCGSLPNIGGVMMVVVAGSNVSDSERLNLGGKSGELIARFRN